MSEDREKMLNRIKKLLEMTERNGATEAEAVAAALAAQKLMAEYDVEAWELSGEMEPIEEVLARRGRRWQSMLALAVAENFRCKVYINKKHEMGKRRRSSYVTFVGYKHDAEAAKLVYEKLAAVGHKEATKFANERNDELFRHGHRKRETKPFYEGFCEEFINGVKSVLEKQSQALMIVVPKKVDERFEDITRGFGRESYRPSTYFGEDYSAGYRAGRDAVMSGRIGAGSTERLLA